MTNKKHALTVQKELKTIATELFEIYGDTDTTQFKWGIEITESNAMDPEIWFGNNYVIEIIPISESSGRIKAKSLISIDFLEDTGMAQVVVDLPDDYNKPKKTFTSEYDFVQDEPLNGFPDALYEAYLYFDKVTDFSYAEKLSFLCGAMWEVAHYHGYLSGYDHQDELGRIIKKDIVN
ncbi:TPA: hypothetical protein ACF5BZ_002676 [Vibrio parahaemolyticus]